MSKNRMKLLVARSVFMWCVVSALVSGVTRAQIQSSAFDPKCYQPGTSGQPREIDTILGSHKGLFYGGGLVNIGPKPENPGGQGRLMFTGPADDDKTYSAVDCGPNFDPRNLTIAQFKGFWAGSRMIFGQFRSKNYVDILLLDSLGNPAEKKIYWQDNSGLYDTSRYTILEYLHHQAQRVDWSAAPYHTFLSTDTAEDLILHYTYLSRNRSRFTICSAFQRGGKYLCTRIYSISN